MKRKEQLIEDVNRRRALGRGLGALQMHGGLCAAGRRARALKALPPDPTLSRMPAWARAWAEKVWRKSRKA